MKETGNSLRVTPARTASSGRFVEAWEHANCGNIPCVTDATPMSVMNSRLCMETPRSIPSGYGKTVPQLSRAGLQNAFDHAVGDFPLRIKRVILTV
jgi:hypothetical protein